MIEEGLSYSIRRVPLAYEHPMKHKDKRDSFIPLLDGGDYWNIIDSMDEYREKIATQSGDEWEGLKNAFFGEPHQKFREELTVNGESVKPENPEHLQKLILENIDNSEDPNPNLFTPIPLSSADEDGFGYALYQNVEWGSTLGIPASQIFTTREEAEKLHKDK